METKELSYRQHKGGLFPMMQVKVLHLGKGVNVDGVIDSGSNYCLFNSEVAASLGLPLERAGPVEITTVSDKVKIYLHQVEMSVLGEPFSCKVGFMRKMGTSFNLLGRAGFFERHHVTFKENEKKVVLEEI